MKPAQVGSFVRFLVGFLTFIGVSLGVTVAVNSYAIAQESAQQQAAAFSALVQHAQ
ncbi:MAG TPA: hypothetical protein VHD38_00910 [Candidatus Paceibacterota bacterium]|nr:hypothetical protein [Candidatus Paceibacterota bacterium]